MPRAAESAEKRQVYLQLRKLVARSGTYAVCHLQKFRLFTFSLLTGVFAIALASHRA
jgi:hypothetical protein